MHSYGTLSRALGVAAVLGVTLAGCGSSSSSSKGSTYNVTGHQTTMSLGPLSSTSLEKAGVTVSAESPATADPAGGIAFPVTGGSIKQADLKGSITHSGGITFKSATGSLTMSDPTLDTTTGMLSATVNGHVNTIANVTPLAVGTSTSNTVIVTGTVSTLFSNFALVVGQALGVSPFQPNQALGPITSTITYKTS